MMGPIGLPEMVVIFFVILAMFAVVAVVVGVIVFAVYQSRKKQERTDEAPKGRAPE